MATVEVEISLENIEDIEDRLIIRGLGSGIDTGDKSVAKAQTMAVKYAWKNSLLIADSSDDPDAVAGKVNYKNSVKPTSNNKINVPF